MTMAAFGDQVRRMAGGYLDKPVIDSNGLKGNWDITIKWTASALLSSAGAEGINL
jgi:uncharacterized protein (TIGR03435 family)